MQTPQKHFSGKLNIDFIYVCIRPLYKILRWVKMLWIDLGKQGGRGLTI